MEIKFLHQEDKTEFSIKVRDADKLTSAEIKRICSKMGVQALLVSG